MSLVVSAWRGACADAPLRASRFPRPRSVWLLPLVPRRRVRRRRCAVARRERGDRDDDAQSSSRQRGDVGASPRGSRSTDSSRTGGGCSDHAVGVFIRTATRGIFVEDASRPEHAGARLVVLRVGLGEDVDASGSDGQRATVSGCGGCHRPTEGHAANLAPETSADGRSLDLAAYIGRSARRGSKSADTDCGAGGASAAVRASSAAAQTRCCRSRLCRSMASAVTIAMKARRSMVWLHRRLVARRAARLSLVSWRRSRRFARRVAFSSASTRSALAAACVASARALRSSAPWAVSDRRADAIRSSSASTRPSRPPPSSSVPMPTPDPTRSTTISVFAAVTRGCSRNVRIRRVARPRPARVA